MNRYQKAKAKLRDKAIAFQLSQTPICLFDLYFIQENFKKQGKRYGLLKEFKENGIIQEDL